MDCPLTPRERAVANFVKRDFDGKQLKAMCMLAHMLVFRREYSGFKDCFKDNSCKNAAL